MLLHLAQLLDVSLISSNFCSQAEKLTALGVHFVLVSWTNKMMVIFYISIFSLTKSNEKSQTNNELILLISTSACGATACYSLLLFDLNHNFYPTIKKQ